MQMDHVIEHRRQDIVVVEKNNNTALSLDRYRSAGDTTEAGESG